MRRDKRSRRSFRETGDSETEEERYHKIKRDDMDWTDKAGYDSDR